MLTANKTTMYCRMKEFNRNIHTPAFRHRSQRIIRSTCHLLWIQKSIGKMIYLTSLTPLMKLLQVIYHLFTRSLPRRRASVVVNVINAPMRIASPFPPKYHNITCKHPLNTCSLRNVKSQHGTNTNTIFSRTLQ